MVGPPRKMTREEVAFHSTPNDAFVIVDGRVYDMTKFAAYHPGGTNILLEYAGKDVTSLFYSLHRSDVLAKYSHLIVGTLDDTSPELPEKPIISSLVVAENAWDRKGWKSPYYKDSHHRIRKDIRKMLRGLQPTWETMEKAGKVPPKEMWKELGELEFHAVRIGPGPHLNGRKLPAGIPPAEFDYFHEQICHEEMGRLGIPAFTDGLGAGMVIGLPPVLVFAPKPLASRVAKDVLSGEKQICLAISEPFAGSDVANIRTRAIKSPDGRHYIVNGVKKWITNGTFSDYFTTAVRTGGSGAAGISVLLIERGPGVTTEPIPVIYGKSAGTAYVTFDNVYVPVENLLYKQDKGFKVIMFNFNHERWMLIAAYHGAARQMVEECFKWAVQREVFGERLIDKPVIRAKLASMAAQLDACHANLENITYQMTQMSFEEQSIHLAGPIALLKYLQTKTNSAIADAACQIFGGRALTQGGMGQYCERFYRAGKMGAILGGSEEIMADLGVRQALKMWPQDSKL